MLIEAAVLARIAQWTVITPPTEPLSRSAFIIVCVYTSLNIIVTDLHWKHDTLHV